MHRLRLRLIIWGIFGVSVAVAQQDPMFTNYHFNGLIFNPAYAGSNEHLTLNLSHRQQWLGFKGAPVTETLLGHTPLKNDRVGIGFTLVNDKIGPNGSIDFSTDYAYRFPVGNFKLSLGLRASISNWRGKFSELTVEQSDDPSFQQNVSRWLPNFGAGAYLYNQKYYFGLGCPRILNQDLRKASAGEISATTVRHLYATAGAAFPFSGDQIVFRPSILLQQAGFLSKGTGAPWSGNLDASVLFRKLFWVGASYRTAFSSKSSHDSANFWAAWTLRNGLRFGAAYDLTLSKIRTASSNSFELMLGYEFDIKVKQVASPRYF